MTAVHYRTWTSRKERKRDLGPTFATEDAAKAYLEAYVEDVLGGVATDWSEADHPVGRWEMNASASWNTLIVEAVHVHESAQEMADQMGDFAEEVSEVVDEAPAQPQR